MNPFQSKSGPEISRLRCASAERYADLLLREAISQLAAMGGTSAIEDFRKRVTQMIHSQDNHNPLEELAVEQMERTIQLVTQGRTTLRGWTEDGPASVEEAKP